MDLENLKKLRLETGIGMSDCKKALDEATGDYNKAIKILRENGKMNAAKKSERPTGEGLIGYKIKDKEIAVIELACETDFVSRGDQFQSLLQELLIALLSFQDNNIDNFLQFNNGDQIVKDKLASKIAALGENILIKKMFYYKTDNEIITYLHNKTDQSDNIGKILAVIFANNNAGKSAEALKKVAMHIAAMKPLYLNKDQVSSEKIEEEKEIYKVQLKDSSKPANIIEKIVDGKIDKYYQENVLLEQELAFEPNTKISDYLAEADKDLQIESFQYFKVGI